MPAINKRLKPERAVKGTSSQHVPALNKSTKQMKQA